MPEGKLDQNYDMWNDRLHHQGHLIHIHGDLLDFGQQFQSDYCLTRLNLKIKYYFNFRKVTGIFEAIE